MSFLAPLMLLGLFGVAVPLVVHLIGRRRAPIRRFAAIDFLMGERKKVARRMRLRELMLLALRIGVCAVLALALAKPLTSCEGHGATVARGPQAAVIIIDNSFAMGYRAGGESLFGRAKARARRLLTELGPEAEVAVVFAAEGAEAPLELSRDNLRLDSQIKEAKLSSRPADTQAALRRAWALLRGAKHETRRIILISPLLATSFPPGDAPWPAGAGPELIVDDVSDGAPLANLAVIGVKAEKAPELGGRGVRVTAEIANYGAREVKDVGVSLRVGERTVARGLVSLGPGEGAQKVFSLPLPGEARAADATVELDGDALAADDRRYLRLELRSELSVLVVDGDPRTIRRDDETFYLETALRPGDRGDSAMALTRITADELAGKRLSDFDVLFLCNVKALPPERVATLAAWVEAGGGLFISVGDNVDADAWNATMARLLPQPLASPREVVPANAPERERLQRAERIGAKVEGTHPVLSVLGAGGLQSLRAARFQRVYLLGPTPRGGEGRRVLARYEGGAPALVEVRHGKGRVLLFTSTIDRDWNDLPIHQAYLPLVQQAARYLARAPAHDDIAQVVVGRPRELPVRPEDTRLDVVGPGGRKTTFESARLRGRQSVSFSATSEPGFYHVAAAGAGEQTRPRPSADFVVNLDPRGSDVRRLDADALPRGAGVGGPDSALAGPPRRRVELWHGLAAALLLFLFAEGLLARR